MFDFFRKATIVLFTLAAFVVTTEAASIKLRPPGFSQSFYSSERNQPGAMTMVSDPLDVSNSKKVLKFSIVPKPCLGDDCEQQSARGSMQQKPPEKTVQPKEAWYGWDIYFPANFPFGDKQIRGHQIFAEFKDQHQCQLVALINNPHSNDQFLSWSMEKPTGKKATQFGGDCEVVFEKPIARFNEILGSWHRFELYANWSKKDDGKFVIYLDGKQVVEYSGFTCTHCDKMNYMLFGNYLCCTPDTKKIAPATVFYRYISSAKTREGLIWK